MTSGPSIVDLFKNSKPRSKLFIQMIPPGFSEEDFKELIKEYLNEIDYIVFRPGKIIRDQYGHLIGLDCPNYGFATINFKASRSCPKFHREFHQFQLSDSYNIKSKLFIEFALMQQVPETTTGVIEAKENFRDLTIFKEFLKTFPFAAKAEEDRLASIGPVAIDLEDEIVAADSQQQVPVPKTSELEAKLSVSIAPTSPLPQVSFSSLLSKNNSKLTNSTEAATPLTEYIKSLSLNEKLLPPADKAKEKREKELKEKEKKERKRKEKEKQERRREEKKKKKEAAKASVVKPDKTEKTVNQPTKDKAAFKTKPTAAATEPLVEKQSQTPQIKGVPKILARKPANETKDPTPVETDKNKPPVSSARQPYIPPSTPHVPASISSDKSSTGINKNESVSNFNTSNTIAAKKEDGNLKVNSPRAPPNPVNTEPLVTKPSVNTTAEKSVKDFESGSVLDSLKSNARKISIPKRTLPNNSTKSHEPQVDLLSDESASNTPRAPYVPPVTVNTEPSAVPEKKSITISTKKSDSSKDHGIANDSLNVSNKNESSKLIDSSKSSNDSTNKMNAANSSINIDELIKQYDEETAAASASKTRDIPSSDAVAKQKSNSKPAKKQPKAKTLAERSGKLSTREVYIRPDLSSAPASDPVAEAKVPQLTQPVAAPRKIVVKTAQSKPTSPKNEPVETTKPPKETSAPVKKVFTSSAAKMRESKQIQ